MKPIIVSLFVLVSQLAIAQSPELVVQDGDVGIISAISYGPQGRYLASSAGAHIKIWDVRSGKVVRNISTLASRVKHLAFSPDGNALLAISYPLEATTVQDMTNREELQAEAQHIRIWDLTTGEEIHCLKGHQAVVNDAIFSPDGRQVLSGSQDGMIFVWDLSSPGQAITIKAHEKPVVSVDFAPDGNQVLSASEDQTAKMWDIAGEKNIATLSGHSNQLSSVAYSPDGRLIATGSKDNTIILWDTKTTKISRTLKGHRGNILTVRFSPDGKFIASGSTDRSVKLWEVATGTEYKSFDDIASRQEGDIAIDFSPDGRYIATSAFRDKAIRSKRMRNKISVNSNIIRIYNIQTKQETQLALESNPVVSLGVSPDGKYIAGYSLDRYIRIWDIERADLSRVVPIDNEAVEQVVFSPQWNYIALVYKQELVLHDFESMDTVAVLDADRSKVSEVVFSHDDRLIACGGFDEKTDVYQIPPAGKAFGEPIMKARTMITREAFQEKREEQKEERKEEAKNKFANKLPKNDKFNKIKDKAKEAGIKEPKKPELKRPDRIGLTPTKALAFSTDGKYLITSRERRTRIWNIETGEKVDSLFGENVGFSHDNEYVFSLDRASVSLEKGVDLDKANLNTRQQDKIFISDPTHRSAAVASETSVDMKVVGLPGQDKVVIRSASGERLLIVPIANDLLEKKTIDSKLLANKFGNQLAEKIELYQLKTQAQEQIKSINVGAFISDFMLHPDKKHLLTASKDGRIALWDIQSGEMLLSMVGSGAEDFVYITPDHYYRLSPQGYNLLGFRIGKDSYPFETLDIKYNRPDKILQYTGRLLYGERSEYPQNDLIKAYKAAYNKRLQKTGVTEAMLSGQLEQPRLTIDTKTLPIESKERQVNVKLTAEDNALALKDIMVWINGVIIHDSKQFDLQSLNKKTYQGGIDLTLSQGKNVIQIAVRNKKGVESMPETFTITYTGPTEKPDLYIIAIGVSKYQTAGFDLNYATKDARDIIQYFEDYNVESYKKIHVDSIFDQQATKANILAVKNKLMNSKVDDQVILFIAGHGLLDADLNYYLATYDVNFMNPKENGLPYSQLEGLLDGIPARNKILLMDACHSGEVDKDEVELVEKQATKQGSVAFRSTGTRAARKKHVGLNNSFEMMKTLFVDLRRSTGATVISSAGGAEFALEGDEWNNGVFTYCLLSGLKENLADENGDGQVMLSELKAYIRWAVPEMTNGLQQPTSRVENISNDFRIK